MQLKKQQNLKKLIIVIFIIGLVILFFTSGLKQYLTLEFIKESQVRFQEIYSRAPLGVIALFVAFYIPVIALNLPGAVILGLGAGALFGTWTGTIIISFASSVGATLACLLSRYLLRDWVQKRFGERLKKVNDGIREEGAFYLFSMRLIPAIPFFIINLVMGLTPMRLWTFYWVSQLGMLPGTAVFVNAGSLISKIDSLSGILSPGLILSLALLGIFPLITKKILNGYRKRFGCDTMTSFPHPESKGEISPGLDTALLHMKDACTRCGACKKQCAFLQEYGTPGEMIDIHDFSRPDSQKLAFECSLCNLCRAVCPEKLDPGSLFLSIRREAAESGHVDFSRYKTILGYEKKGSSPLFSYYALPDGCDTVFFPGCTLPGTRPETTWKLFEHLRKRIPGLGMALDCCTKPSHDLGRQGHFESMFNDILDYLIGNGIKTLLTACPNCHKIFTQYGSGLEVKTVYEVIDPENLPVMADGNREVTVHDPCPMREETHIQSSVRNLLKALGVPFGEMKHRGKKTLCCGEGGCVGFVKPGLAQKWGLLRQKESENRTIVTYCAGCAGFLSRVTPTLHIADILFSPGKAFTGGIKVAKAPFTYLNRLRLKQRFKKTLEPCRNRARIRTPEIPASPEENICTLEDCASSLCRKGIALSVVFSLSIALFFLIRHFMYILDSYVYTAEFHFNFVRTNQAASQIDLFRDYFKALGPIGSLPYLMAADIIGTVYAPLKSLVVHAGMTTAFGLFPGGMISLVSLMIMSSIYYGCGRFFLGDILPLIRRTREPLSMNMVPVMGILVAIPYLPLALPSVLGAFTKIGSRSMILLFPAALTVRIILLMMFFWPGL